MTTFLRFATCTTLLVLATVVRCQTPCPAIGTLASDPTLALPQGRSDTAAAIDFRGQVYLPGGNVSTTAPFETSTVLKLDPATSAWTSVAAMLQPRASHAVAADGRGRVFVFGGAQSSGSPIRLATAEIYEPTTDSWTSIAPLPVATIYPRAVASMDGRHIFVIGGQTSSGATANVYRYDITANTWFVEPPMTVPRSGGPFGVARGPAGEIYAANGGTAEVRDPSSGQWHALPAYSGIPNQADACVVDPSGRFFILGGYGNSAPVDTIVAYDPATLGWTTCAATLPQAAANQAMALPDDGRILLIGGDVNGSRLPDVVVASARFGTLSVRQPAGPGSILIRNDAMPPLNAYLTNITANGANAVLGGVGGLGTGWWHGLHISFGEVIAQYLSGAPPCWGMLDGSGSSTYALPPGALSSASGTVIYAVTTTYVLPGTQSFASNCAAVILR